MTQKTGTIVLLSGGLDSAAALAWALAQTPGPHTCISFYYGQRHSREREAASAICLAHGLHPPYSFNLAQAFSVIGGSSLTSGLVHGNPSTEPVDRTSDALPPTFVPGRNLVFLSLAYGLAYTSKAHNIVGGWNAVDYSGYPDCRPEFLAAFSAAADIGLDSGEHDATPIRLHAPLVSLTKADIIKLGLKHQAHFELSWSCYSGGEAPCGVCDSCQIRRDGFLAAGLADPALSEAV